MRNDKETKIDEKITAFLSHDPVPELDDWEVKVLTQRVLARTPERKPFRIFGFKPVWGIGVAVVAIILFFAIHIASPEMGIQDFDYAELTGETMPEDMLYEAISSGDLDEETALAGLISVPDDNIEEVYYTYTDNEIDAAIEMLSDEEVENVLRYISEMQLNGDQEVL